MVVPQKIKPDHDYATVERPCDPTLLDVHERMEASQLYWLTTAILATQEARVWENQGLRPAWAKKKLARPHLNQQAECGGTHHDPRYAGGQK
jgi:hypothetical protein